MCKKIKANKGTNRTIKFIAHKMILILTKSLEKEETCENKQQRMTVKLKYNDSISKILNFRNLLLHIHWICSFCDNQKHTWILASLTSSTPPPLSFKKKAPDVLRWNIVWIEIKERMWEKHPWNMWCVLKWFLRAIQTHFFFQPEHSNTADVK